MRGQRNGQAARRSALFGIASVLALLLGGCGTSNLLGSAANIFDSKKATTEPATGDAVADDSDIECPGVAVRTGAATLLIGGEKAGGEPGALDVRYQGSIIRNARECHVKAGVMTMKVGIEGRIITGPAGGPGTVDVPLRVAVVREGVNPRTIISKFVSVPVTVTSAIDRVVFTHVESDLAFPMPVPAGDIDAYVVYVGFDTLTAQQQNKKPAPRRKPNTAAKPKQG